MSLLDNTGEMLVAINDMSITEHITPAFLRQHQDFICGAAVIVVDCNISESALAWLMENSGSTPIFVDPVSAWKCVKISQHLGRIHTLKPNRIEAETLSGIALSGTDDVARRSCLLLARRLLIFASGEVCSGMLFFGAFIGIHQ